LAKLDGLTSLAGGLIDDATLASLRAADAADAAANQGILGYHGSPADFEQFQFNKYMGTGEGAQAYGRGGYFAESENVAEEYLRQLTPRNYDFENYLLLENERALNAGDYTRAELIERAMTHDRPRDFRERAKDFDYDQDYRSQANAFADEMEAFRDSEGKPVNFGNMYQVRIQANNDELLDLFAPLDEQPPGVQAKLEATDWFETVSKILNTYAQENPYGMELLRYLENDGSEFAAQTLQDAGLKGVRYLDGNSRSRRRGQQTENYVIFDDKYVDIAKKYGIPLAAMTTLSAAPQDAEAGIVTASLSPVLRASMDKVLRGEEVSKSELNSVNKYLGEIAADRTAFGRRERMRMTPGASQDVDVMQRDIITPESMQGEMLVPIQGDASIAGGILDNVEGVPLDQEIYLQGGPNYPLMNSYGNNLLGWASMRDAAQTKQNQITRAGLLGDDVRGVYARMGDEAMNFNTMVAEAMVRQLPALQLPKKEIARFNKDIRGSVPDFAGVETAEGLAQLKGQLPATKENGKAISSSDLRKLVVGRMSLKKEYGNKGFPNYEDTVRALTEPELRGLERGDSGFSTIRGMPGENLLDNAYHDTYSHGIPGIYAGGLEESVPLQVMFPDLFRATGDKVITKESSKRFGEPLNAQERVGAVLMGGDAQKADQQWLDGVMKYLEDKKKMGRAAAIAAATSSGNAMAIPPEDLDIQNEIDARRAGGRKYRRDNPPSGLLAAEAQSQVLPRAAEAGQGFVSGLLSGIDTFVQGMAAPDPRAAIASPQGYGQQMDSFIQNQQLPPTQNPNSMMSTPAMRGLLDQQYMEDPAERAAFRAPFEAFGGLLAPYGI
jgi:hypothetical protein